LENGRKTAVRKRLETDKTLKKIIGRVKPAINIAPIRDDSSLKLFNLDKDPGERVLYRLSIQK
jgi:hypothetical protein